MVPLALQHRNWIPACARSTPCLGQKGSGGMTDTDDSHSRGAGRLECNFRGGHSILLSLDLDNTMRLNNISM